AELLEPILLLKHRFFPGSDQAAIIADIPVDAVAVQYERLFTGIMSNPGVGIIPKSRIQHIVDMHEFVTTIPSQRGIVEPSRNQLDADTLQPLFLELFCEIVLDGPPLPKHIDSFLIFLEYTLDQHDTDTGLELRKLIEGVA